MNDKILLCAFVYFVLQVALLLLLPKWWKAAACPSLLVLPIILFDLTNSGNLSGFITLAAARPTCRTQQQPARFDQHASQTIHGQLPVNVSMASHSIETHKSAEISELQSVFMRSRRHSTSVGASRAGNAFGDPRRGLL